MRIVLCLIIVMLFAGAAIADERTVALDSEKKLDKSITISLRAAALRDVLAEVEKATGVHLLVQRDIAEDKATVWVKDQPAREVLRSLAHCFNLCWSQSLPNADRPYLRLWMDRGYLAAMHHREYQDCISLENQFDDELKAIAEYVRVGTQYTPDEEMLYKLKRENPREFVRLDRKRNITRSPSRSAGVVQFLALSDKQKESLFAGEHVTVSGSGICANALKAWPDAKSFDYSLDRNVSGYTLRCGTQPGAGSENISGASYDDSPYVTEADGAAKRISSDPELDRDMPARDTSDRKLHPGEGSATVPATMSDGLLELAQAANIPIVAQYVSEYAGVEPDWGKGTFPSPPSAAKKIGERLGELGKQHLFAVSRDGSFLLANSLLWHRLRLREIPEDRIRSWQKELSGPPVPTFGGYVDLAATKWEQVRGVFENCRFWFGPQDMRSLPRCEYALKLYGTLTADQKQWLASGAELRVSTLKPEQQMTFMSGFEVRERPTFEKAADQNWPDTASFSLRERGYGDTGLYAVAKMTPVGSMAPDPSTVKVPDGTPEEKVDEVFARLVEAQFPSLKAKLSERIAKEHPEVAAKDVSFYCVRYCVFTLQLGGQVRKCGLTYSAKVK